MCICVYIYIYICIPIYLSIYLYISMYIHNYIYIIHCDQSPQTCLQALAQLFSRNINTELYVYKCIYIHVYIYIYIYICTNIHIHKHMYIYIYTYMYTHIKLRHRDPIRKLVSWQPPDGVRTNRVVTEVPVISFHRNCGNMCQHVAKCMVSAATCRGYGALL